MDIVTYALAKNYADTVGKPTPEEIGAAVDAYLEEHQVAAGMKRIVYTLSKSGSVYSLKDSEGNNVNFDTLFTTIKDEKNYVVVLYGNSKLRPQYVSTNEIHCDGIDRDSSTTRFLRMVMTYSSLTYATFELAEKTDLNNYVANTEKGAVNGVATLDGNGKLTSTQLPLGTGATVACAGNDSRLSDARPSNDVQAYAKIGSGITVGVSVPSNAKFTDTTYSTATTSADGLMSSTDKTKLNNIATGATAVSESTVRGWGFTKNTGTVTSVKVGSQSYSQTDGVVSLPAYPTTLPASDVKSWAKADNKPTYTASEIGLGNVNNTSDADKPISTATQDALDGKQNALSFMTTPSSTNKVATKTEIDAEDAQIADIYNRAGGGKNLFVPTLEIVTGETSEISVTNNDDGTYTFNGTAVSTNFMVLLTIDTFAVPESWKKEPLFYSCCPVGGSSTTYRALIQSTDNYAYATICTDFGSGAEVNFANVNLCRFVFTIYKGTSVNNLTIKPMLRLASIKDDTFVPYAPTNRELYETTEAFEAEISDIYNRTGGGKNLINITAISGESHSIHFTINNNKTVLIDGTNDISTSATFEIGNTVLKADETYVLSAGDYDDNVNLRVINSDNPSLYYRMTNKALTFTPTASGTYAIRIYVSGAATINNLLYKPMLRLASIKDDTFVPYVPTNAELYEMIKALQTSAASEV